MEKNYAYLNPDGQDHVAVMYNKGISLHIPQYAFLKYP